MNQHDAALTYSSYLALDEILGAQRPRSAEHDEMLFIVNHQVYELWFKQLIHEIRRLQRKLYSVNAPQALHTLHRILTILKVVVAQIDVLETMTPRQFTNFRDRLAASSGFQSAQFRQLEILLGSRDRRVLAHYPPDSSEYAEIEYALHNPALYDSFLGYLDSTGYPIPTGILQRDVTQEYEPDENVQHVLLGVYADDGESARICEYLVDLDEGMQEWRYRHVKMVERTIGDKSGTGGSTGVDYLRSTLFRPAFPDLWTVRSSL